MRFNDSKEKTKLIIHRWLIFKYTNPKTTKKYYENSWDISAKVSTLKSEYKNWYNFVSQELMR